MLIGEVQPTPKRDRGRRWALRVHRQGLRRLETTSVAELTSSLSRAGLAALPVWTAPAAPVCGSK